MKTPSLRRTLLHGTAILYLSALPAFAGAPAPGQGARPGPADPQQGPAPIVFNQRKASATAILAKLKKPDKIQAAAVASDQEGLKIERTFTTVPGLQRLIPKPGHAALEQATVAQKIKQLKASGLYEYVEPDWIVHVEQTPTDSAFVNGDLWGLNNTGQNGGTSGVDVNAVAAWSLSTGSPAVIVGVIDTGIRYTHQDLAGNMWTNPGEIAANGVDDDGNGFVDDVHGINAITGSGDPFDDNSHGSHVAGTIAATANDGGQVVGVAYNVRLMGLKFLAASGNGSVSDAITCIDYAVSKGVDILNNSWGGGGFSSALQDSISAANSAGVLFVAAAGNDATNNDLIPHYPSNYEVPNVVAVAAIDRTGALAGFSCYGPTSVDIGAPGVAILSCTADSDSSYGSFNGTSMATPHVSGVAALVASQHPGISMMDLKNRLLATTAPLASLAGNIQTGGMVDAHAAMTVTQDGNLELSASGDSPLIAGSNARFIVNVTDLSPVLGANVTGNLDGGTSAIFHDDGLTPDLVANDGFYSANLTVPSAVSSVDLNISASATGKNPASETFTFTVITPPPNDPFAGRITLPATTTQTTGTNEAATLESGEPVNPSTAGGKTVWWSWTPTWSGNTTISTTGSNFDTTLAIYVGSSLGTLSLVGANDDSSGLQSAVGFVASAGTTYQIQVDGYAGNTGNIQLNYPDPGGSDSAPVIITQPSGRSVVIGDPFTLSVSAAGSTPLEYQWNLGGIPISGAINSSYTVAAAGDADEGYYTVLISNSFGSVLSNSAYVAVDPIGLAPPNDNFAQADLLPGTSGQIAGTNIRATAEPGEPDHADASDPVASVWYQWTAPQNGDLHLDTDGSDFDTTLAVYTGSEVTALTEKASNDDSNGIQSAVDLTVTAGTTYRIAVDGFSSSEGQIVLGYSFVGDSGGPPNDIFANRIDLGSGSNSTTGTNTGATGETNEPIHAGVSAPLASVWWSWTALSPGTVTISTVGSDFDTTLGVYTGVSVNALTEVASNDDANTVQSEVSFAVTPGTTYHIAVDGYGSSNGSIYLEIAFSGSGGGGGGSILLIEDQTGFGNAASILAANGFDVTVQNNEFTNSYANLLNPTYLAQFDFVVYGERGGGSGNVLPSNAQASLEAYIQAGGHLLVTGYDTLGSPTDANLAALVRAVGSGDLVSDEPIWSVANIDHPILNGPYGDYRGLSFPATAYDDDSLSPDTAAGAIELVATGSPRTTGKLIFTDLPGAAGSVGYWNGGLNGMQNAQPDFSDGGNPQAIFLNYAIFATSNTGPEITNVLYFDDDFTDHNHAFTALQNLGLNVTVVDRSNGETFPEDLSPYDLLVIESYDNPLDSSHEASIGSFIATGKPVILNYWNLDGSTTLQALFELSVVTDIVAPETIHFWDPGSPLFQGISGPLMPIGDNSGYDNGDKVTATGGAQTVAGYSASATAGQGAIVIGNGGRTVANTFSSPDFTPAAMETLFQNEILFLGSIGSNLPPVADTGSDFSVIDTGSDGFESVVLDAQASYDPDGTIVSWEWTWSSGSASGESPGISLPLGTTTITLTVTDDDGAMSSDSIDVTVSPISLTLVGTNGDTWFLNASSGLLISDASFSISGFSSSDAFDGASMILVDGISYTGTAVEVTTTKVVGQTQNVSGVDVTVSFEVLPDHPALRTIVTLENNSLGTLTPSLAWMTNWGSDSGTVIHQTSSGDNLHDTTDYYSVTNDQPNPALDSFDPTNVTYWGDGTALQPTAITGDAQGLAGLTATYNLALAPGGRVCFLFAHEIARSADAGAAAAQATLVLNDLISNLPGTVLASLANWTAGSEPNPRILLIEDQSGFGNAANILTANGFDVTVMINEFANSYANLLNPTYLSQFDFVVYGERGEGSGNVLPSNAQASLEAYIQAGGHLLVTGYDTLGDPTDANLAALVRAVGPGDLVSTEPIWSVANIDHPILNGPFGDYRGLVFPATGYDDDQLAPDTAVGAVELVATGNPRETSKLIFTDLPGAAGSVGYWNGGLKGTKNAQPDFSDGGNPQSIFLNYAAFATSTVPGQPEISIQLSGTELQDGVTGAGFGPVSLGQSLTRSFLVRNLGGASLDGISISMTGAHPSDFDFGLLPASLAPGASTTVGVTFTPSSTGSRTAELQVMSDDIDESTFDVALTGTSGTASNLYYEAADAAGLSPPDWDPLDSSSDGVQYLLKYASNIPLNGGGLRTLLPGGTDGLPLFTFTPDGTGGIFRFEYIRRKASGLVYQPLRSSALDPLSFQPMTGSQTVTDLDDFWEQVVIEEAINIVTQPVGFGRMSVSIP